MTEEVRLYCRCDLMRAVPLPGYLHRVLDWECGNCGRIYRPSGLGWVEIRGATK